MMGWDAMAARAAEARAGVHHLPLGRPVAGRPAPRGRLGPDRSSPCSAPRPSPTSSPKREPSAPDLVVIDCMLTAGYAAAQRLGLPVASLVHVRLRAVRAPVGQRGPRHRRRRPARASAVRARPAATRLRPARTAAGQHAYVGARAPGPVPRRSTRPRDGAAHRARRPVGAAQPEHDPAGAGERRCPGSWRRWRPCRSASW